MSEYVSSYKKNWSTINKSENFDMLLLIISENIIENDLN